MSRQLAWWMVVFALAGMACGKDEPAKANSSAGGESNYRKATRRANEVHEEFKEAVKPVAGWVDEKSHQAADEARKAVGADGGSQPH